jgi:hypothetical protein
MLEPHQARNLSAVCRDLRFLLCVPTGSFDPVILKTKQSVKDITEKYAFATKHHIGFSVNAIGNQACWKCDPSRVETKLDTYFYCPDTLTPKILLTSAEFDLKRDTKPSERTAAAFNKMRFQLAYFLKRQKKLSKLTIKNVSCSSSMLDEAIRSYTYGVHKTVKYLVFECCTFTCENLNYLKSETMTTLELKHCPTVTCFVFLSGLPNLKSLVLSNCHWVTHEELAWIALHCPNVAVSYA